MPIIKEFTVLMDDQPGTLGKVCRALADRNVNILALYSFPIGGKSVTRLIADNPTTAKTVLDAERLTCTETEVVQVKLLNKPGRDRACGVAPGRGQHQYQLCVLWFGVRYEFASGLLWCRGSQ